MLTKTLILWGILASIWPGQKAGWKPAERLWENLMVHRPDLPWIMRTYAGHTSASVSNELYRRNLAKGQTGISVAFDLPTQIGYDPDDPMAAGEVGRVGVPVAHLGHMRDLFADIPLARANTSLTINATAMFELALLIVAAEEQGAAPAELAGTTQNDMVKEFLARGTYAFPPGPSLRVAIDLIAFTVVHMPRWNPINVCSYHLQEAGATPVQEVAYSLANALTVLDAVRASGQIPEDRLADVAGRMSFFLNAGLRFVGEQCKVRAFAQLWDGFLVERYGITEPKARRFRYGVQVNSLGLTALQPENNIIRITLEMLGVTLGRDSRARAIQLPAWNEALGLPRPWDQQWSLRAQQVLAYETDLLEYGDIFAGSQVIERETASLIAAVRSEMERIDSAGGLVAGVETGELKQRLVAAMADRQTRRESGAEMVVGVNAFTESEASPLLVGQDSGVLAIDAAAEQRVATAMLEWRASRDSEAVERTLQDLQVAARTVRNLMLPTLACVRAGVTVGEWARALREVFGEYRAPTGVAGSVEVGVEGPASGNLRLAVRAAQERSGRRLRMLVAKPGLDGHSNGAEQVALRARDAGIEVIYQGIRQTPEQIVAAAVAEDVSVVALSVLSGAHVRMAAAVLAGLAEHDMADVPVVIGGTIPDADAAELRQLGVAATFTAKDTDLGAALIQVVDLIARD